MLDRNPTPSRCQVAIQTENDPYIQLILQPLKLKRSAMSLAPLTEYSNRFIERMKQAMIVSYHKYGPFRKAYPHKINAIACLEARLRLYKQTGNADYLIDIANFAMIEFMLPAHTNHHDSPTDGGEGRYWHAGGKPTEKPNTV